MIGYFCPWHQLSMAIKYHLLCFFLFKLPGLPALPPGASEHENTAGKAYDSQHNGAVTYKVHSFGNLALRRPCVTLEGE